LEQTGKIRCFENGRMAAMSEIPENKSELVVIEKPAQQQRRLFIFKATAILTSAVAATLGMSKSARSQGSDNDPSDPSRGGGSDSDPNDPGSGVNDSDPNDPARNRRRRRITARDGAHDTEHRDTDFNSGVGNDMRD
jgi:hypothetical protein